MKTPEWLNKANVKKALDARPLLASGIHPLELVLDETATYVPGEVFGIITPFPPAPMIEKMQAAGFDHFMEQENGVFHTWFLKK